MAHDPNASDAHTSRRQALTDPNLAPFLPMVYLAWSDGDLDPEEMKAICTRLRDAVPSATSCSDALGAWLDPDAPPSASDLRGLLHRIRGAGEALSTRERVDLATLGLELAATADGVSSLERDALAEVERALGVDSTEAARQLLASRRPGAGPVRHQPTFPTALMTTYLDGAQRPTRERMRALLREPVFAYTDPGLARNAYRDQVLHWCRTLAEHGFGALSFPSRAGGQDDTPAFLASFETLAHHDLSLLVKYGVQFGLWGGSVMNLGTAHHHETYLPKIGSLELPGCFAMTETGHGSNVYDIETVARLDRTRDAFDLHTPHAGARKDYIGNAALHGRMATVFAQLVIDDEDYGVHAFVVPIRDDDGQPLPGISIEDCGAKLGLNGVDNGRIGFDHVEVPRSDLLDRFAQVDADGNYSSDIASPSKRFFTMLGTLVGGRVSIALAALSASKSALAIAVRYGNRRRQFGPDGTSEIALNDYPTHQRRLIPRVAKTYALHFALRHMGRRYAETLADTDRREIETLAAGLKAVATWHATETIQVCRECCGGQGYLAVNRFAALKADSDIFSTFEGDNTVLLQLVAKGLLTRFKKQFHAMGLIGMVRYVAEQAAKNVAERNPIATRTTDEQHLRDRAFQGAALRWREDVRLRSVARRMKKRLDRGESGQQALMAHQVDLLETAQAHVERIVHEHFTAGIEHAPVELQPVLGKLCDLYALDAIARDRGWFLEHGYVEAKKARAIREQIGALCSELRPEVEALTEAWAIPPELLSAPIAHV